MATMTKDEILREFELFSIPMGGIGSWLSKDTHDDVFVRLSKLDSEPLSPVQLNQLLVLGHEAPVGDAFYRYYWKEAPQSHPYNLRKIPGFDETFLGQDFIQSLAHLKWGLYRLYVDGMLYFGNIRTAFRRLRDLSSDELNVFFSDFRFDTAAIKARGPALPLIEIPKDSRYLISEMACKSYGDIGETSDLRTALLAAYKAQARAGKPTLTIKDLLEGSVPTEFKARQQEFAFSADEVLDETVDSEEMLNTKFEIIAHKFSAARSAALNNTRLYLSMVNDLDVYVATSMRNRNDFRQMSETCEKIFLSGKLQALNLRHFDPTLSAAGGHEDKGLIECLMVKCAKALVYCAGEKESYGKDAEAAMALSLGKFVIFYCEQRSRFYRDVHPLSRLIDFKTGIAVGAMVTDKLDDVSELLYRIFENAMEYRLEQSKPGFLRLKDTLTDSVVRIQTNDRLLTETFWNHYHKDQKEHVKGGIAGD